MAETTIVTRYTAECTRNYLRSRRPVDYVATTDTLITWLETIITLHQMLEAAGVRVPGAVTEAGKCQEEERG